MNQEINIEKILLSFFDAKSLESNDFRFSNMEGDYYQHRINNTDREEDRFIDDQRFNLLGISDQKFLELMAFVIHPENIIDSEIKYKVINIINDKLVNDWYEVVFNGEKISGHKLYSWKAIELWKKKIGFYNMWFLHTSKRSDPPIEKDNIKSFPSIVVYSNPWNDYGYFTTFFLYYCGSLKSNLIEIWEIKIFQKSLNTTNIPDSFYQLDEQYCSLFQYKKAYINLKKYCGSYYETVLSWLNEVTHKSYLYEKYKDEEGFKKSLIRDPEAYSIIFESWLVDWPENKDVSFGVNFEENSINFAFSKNEVVPYRINVLIGKNWSGKTRLLSWMVKWIVEYQEELHHKFFIKRPIYWKVISISYSVFDNFDIPKSNENCNYIYCWLRKPTYENIIEPLESANEIGLTHPEQVESQENIDYWILTPNELYEKFSKTIDQLKEKNLINLWKYHIKSLFDYDWDFSKRIEEYSILSSWEKILLTFFSEILLHIEKNTLLLFDEPETHLHPNIVFKLVKTLYWILDTYDSYLIIATHSPIILQQIPSKHVILLNNDFWSLKVQKLHNESFGENFSAITREIFGNYENDNIFYKELFKNLIQKGFEEATIAEAFNNNLSLNARIFLKTLTQSK